MSRRDLSSRTRTRLTDLVELLERTGSRTLVLAGGTVVVLMAHAALADPRMAWLSAPLVLLAGLSSAVRTALVIALVLAAGHAVVDLLVVGVRPGELIGIGVRSAALPFLAVVGSVGSDLERQRHRAMERAASEDPVTGLLNVRVFYDELAARRAAQQPFTILLADLRGMRDLNERYGHPTGTEAMRVLAHVLRRAAGRDALLARLGSDEIAVMVPGSDRTRCHEVVDAVVDRLASERVRLPDGDQFAVHASYGIARFPEDGEDEVAVLRVADSVKDRAKATGLDPVGTADSDVAHDAGRPQHHDELGHA
jgi:diguanylate cyclase (GGDEF)-like protein